MPSSSIADRVLALAQRHRFAPQRFEQRAHADALGRHLVLRFEPRQRQQVLDDLRHAPRLVAQLAQDRLVFLHLLGLDQVEIAVHDRQRRAQLVRDVRDEIAAHLLEAHQLADVARDQQRLIARIADQAQVEPQVLVAGRGQVAQRIDAAAAQPVDDARRAQEIGHVAADVLRDT